MREAALKKAAMLACALVLALVLRAPLVGSNSRYFYHEDDAHHFNRTVEMAQRFDLNPSYFNKPALHFYLRMPVVWASAAWGKLRGELGSLQEMRTRDPYGLGGYAFSASHPLVLEWSRWFSVGLSACIIALTFVLALRLLLPPWGAFLAAMLVTVSPEVLSNSHIIGVDVPMALFCLLSTVLGIRALSAEKHRRWLALCGVVAGLAGATKYNAAPAAVVPLAVALLRDRSFTGLAIALLSPAFGYLCGAPYSLLSFNEFWAGLSYEVWHYSVSGHEGHSATPGFGQALFYLRWMASDGLGPVAAALAAVGAISCALRRTPERLVFLAFPVAYFALMVAQKTNFTRNMVAIVPHLAVASAIGLHRISQALRYEPVRLLISSLLALSAFATPLLAASRISLMEAIKPESREILREWLEMGGSRGDVALAGAIQAAPALWRHPGVVVFNSTVTPLAQLAQQGVSLVVLPANEAAAVSLPFAVDLAIPGNPINRHEPENPAITVLRVTDQTLQAAQKEFPAQLSLVSKDGQLSVECGSREEQHCWLQSHQTELSLPRGTTRFTLQAMSPWPGQQVSAFSSQGELLASIRPAAPGEWVPLTVSIPTKANSVIIQVEVIHAPDDQGLSQDSRRLGAAIRAVSGQAPR